MQIFDVLRAIGGYHTFSAGLVIGGKSLKDESERLSRMNILVATPGRLLQHMDQTIGFDCQNLQVLVLDEADRILDMGFAKAMNAIIAHLPSSRQTLLFSATQTESVSDLARLSLKDPVHVGVKEENHDAATPKGLEQHYIICDLPRKLDTLFSFVKTHLQVKALVFFSTCKQVRFAFETFCKLHPGISIMQLHGKQKQSKRLEIFQKFTTAKHAFLFATDIAARGLDFPAVDWVVQLDAPEDAETYIHRVGRTARYQSQGKSLLFLLPGEEEGFIAALKVKSIEPHKIKVKQSQTMGIQNQLQSFAFQDPDIKYLAQRVSRPLFVPMYAHYARRPLFLIYALFICKKTSRPSNLKAFHWKHLLNRSGFQELRGSNSSAKKWESSEKTLLVKFKQPWPRQVLQKTKDPDRRPRKLEKSRLVRSYSDVCCVNTSSSPSGPSTTACSSERTISKNSIER
jgi:superfamily II DNA/RNA helicase